MESDLSGISNENQISWFGFSAISFSDCGMLFIIVSERLFLSLPSVFNSYVDTWKEVCNEEFKHSLKNVSDSFEYSS